MLGADGVQIGTRFWAATEALDSPRHHEVIIEATGDDTLRTTTPDIARQIKWPPGFTARVRRNAFTQRWHGREEELERSIAVEGPKYRKAFTEGDPDRTAVWFGETAGVIGGIEPAGEIVRRIAGEAEALLADAPRISGDADD